MCRANALVGDAGAAFRGVRQDHSIGDVNAHGYGSVNAMEPCDQKIRMVNHEKNNDACLAPKVRRYVHKKLPKKNSF